MLSRTVHWQNRVLWPLLIITGGWECEVIYGSASMAEESMGHGVGNVLIHGARG